MRAKADIEATDQHDKIVITEIPYGVNKAQLIEDIANLMKDGRLDGISNANDESDREGMRIVVDVKRDANARVVLNKLFKMTSLQTSFSVNAIALVKGRPRLLTLKDCISNFVEHRHEVVIRRTKFDLRKAEERAHILEGLIIASDNIDEVVRIIRASQTPADAQRNLESRFNLDELQSKAIVDMRLSQLTGLRQEDLHNEYDELQAKIAYFNQILTDDNLCRQVIKDELIEVKEKYSDERKTQIMPSAEEFNAEDFYADDEVLERSINGREYDYLFDFYAKLTRLLAHKCDLGVRLRNAYIAKDKETLKKMADEEFPPMQVFVRQVYEAYRTLWYKENQSIGFEMQEMRFGALLLRNENCQRMIYEYLNGELSAIQELELPRLPGHCGAEGKGEFFNSYIQTISANSNAF